MPYLTCLSCGALAYRVKSEPCPACGVPAPPEPIAGALSLAREELGVDAALVTYVADGRETVRWTAGGRAFGIEPGTWAPLEDTICRQLLEGRVDGLVPDVRTEPALAEVSLAQSGLVGAYLGVPLRAEGARLYVLCCIAREERPDLGPEDMRFLAGLAETVRAALDAR